MHRYQCRDRRITQNNVNRKTWQYQKNNKIQKLILNKWRYRYYLQTVQNDPLKNFSEHTDNKTNLANIAWTKWDVQQRWKKHTHIKKKKTIRQTKQETPELTHIMPAPKNSIESQQQTWQSRKEIRELKDKSFELSQLKQKNKKNERMKKAFGAYGTAKERIYMLWESQKKRGRKG